MTWRLLKTDERLSSKKVHAIHRVITINRDVMDLLVQRGVSIEDVDLLCDMAIREAERDEQPSEPSSK